MRRAHTFWASVQKMRRWERVKAWPEGDCVIRRGPAAAHRAGEGHSGALQPQVWRLQVEEAGRPRRQDLQNPRSLHAPGRRACHVPLGVPISACLIRMSDIPSLACAVFCRMWTLQVWLLGGYHYRVVHSGTADFSKAYVFLFAFLF